MRLYNPHLPRPPKDPYLEDLDFALQRELKGIALRHDLIASGMIEGTTGRGTSAPTTGTWAQGDYIKNSNPSELGSAGSKYWIRGWWCSVGGTPGTWLQDRGLTGN